MILKTMDSGHSYAIYSGLTDTKVYSSQDISPKYFYCSDGQIYTRLEDDPDFKWLVQSESFSHYDVGVPPAKDGDKDVYLPICAVEGYRGGNLEKWFFLCGFLMSDEGKTIERLS